MTEPPNQSLPDQPEVLAPPPRAARRPLLPWLYAIGFLVLAAAIVWVWQNPTAPTEPRNDALAQQLGTLEARVARLEQRPAPAPVDLGPLTQRVAALEQRPTTTAAVPSSPVPDLAPVAARLDALSARDDAFGNTLRAQQSDVARRLDADEARIAAIERNSGQITALADRASRMARVQMAQAALEAGQPLGDIPDAPAPLARFAKANPPTIGSLRLAFPDAARAALAAARPVASDKPLLDRLWAEAQELITVRQDGRVIIGDPAVTALDRARAALDAGDLAAAVAAVGSLSGSSAQAMAAWQAEARALLDARAALAELAAHA